MSAAAMTMSAVPTDMAVRAMRKSISENFGVGRRLSHPSHLFNLSCTPDLSGKVAVVTGATEGIGYATARTLLAHGIAHVHLLAPSYEVAYGSMADLQMDLGADDAAGRVTWHQVDLSDWPAVHETASRIVASELRLDILVNNATVLANPTRSASSTAAVLAAGGIADAPMSANHVGHVVLTSALLPLLKRTSAAGWGPVRIVNQASDAHATAPADTRFVSTDELRSPRLPADSAAATLYARSKLANILHARYLARRLTLETDPNILVNAAHPGFPDAEDNALVSPDRWDAAASSTVYAATVTDRSGEYVCPPAALVRGSDAARDSVLAERLMAATREVLCDRFGVDDWEDC